MAEGRAGIERALAALGEILDAQGTSVALVVVGGAAMILDAHVRRATGDVDVIAVSQRPEDPREQPIKPAGDLMAKLSEAVSKVARDFGLP